MTSGHTEQLVCFGLALLAGGVLWAMGSMVLRLGIALAGMALGAMIGWLAWIETGGSFPLWIVMAVFAAVVGLVGLAIYRLLLAGLLAGICASVAFVTIWCLLALTPTGDPPSDRIPATPLAEVGMLLTGSHEPAPAAPTESASDASSAVPNLLPAATERAEALRRHLVERITALWGRWQLLSPRAQLSIVGGVLGGLLLGLLLATFLQKTSAMLVTAVAGSILLIGSISRLLAMIGAPTHQLVDVWAPLPSVVLITLSIAGLVVQMSLLRRRNSRQEPAASS